MRKVSKLVVMVVVVLAVIATMSGSVKAYTNSDLMTYVNDVHNINGMLFELPSSAKAKIQAYLGANPVDEATANSIKADIDAIESKIAATGATSVDQISVNVKSEVVALAKTAVAKAGLVLEVNTSTKTVTVTTGAGVTTGKEDEIIPEAGEVLFSLSYEGRVQSVAGVNGEQAAADHARNLAAMAAANNSGSTLLYTGANYAVYVLPVLAIIAVAIIAKKRA